VYKIAKIKMRYGALIDYNHNLFTSVFKQDASENISMLESVNDKEFDGRVTHKIFLCGKTGSGKTSLVYKLSNIKTLTSYDTLGIQVYDVYWPVRIKETSKTILFKLSLWDCGELCLNSYNHLLPSCLEEADCILYTFSLNNKSMYDDLPKLISRIDAPDEMLKIFAATKFDTKQETVVNKNMLEDLCHVWKMPVLTFQNDIDLNSSNHIADIAPFLNRLCELLWYHDQVKGGLFPLSTVDYCFQDERVSPSPSPAVVSLKSIRNQSKSGLSLVFCSTFSFIMLAATKMTRSWALTRKLTNQMQVLTQVRHSGDGPQPIKVDIGTREVVGYGTNGEEVYVDNVHFPFPAIRFQEDKGEIATLRQKELGDWKKLTMEEKKALYRASFCLTFKELEAPSGEWKVCLAAGFWGLSFAVIIMILMKAFVYKPLPETITDEKKVLAQIHRMVKQHQNPITGVASLYDYDKNEWKPR